MRWILFIFLPFLSLVAKPKIYDCFLFFNELELLEIRLHEMYDYVDHFVLVESIESFMGKPKPLHYAQNKNRFKDFNDKIIHVIITDHFKGGCWERESFQRNEIMQGLKSCKEDDIVIISDLDEILRGSDIRKFVKPLKKQEAKYVSADLKFYSHYLNRQRKDSPLWRGPTAALYSTVKKKSPQKLREQKNKHLSSGDLGWHFSSVGGLSRYLDKIENFSHASEHDAQKKDPKNIFAFIQTELELVPIDETFPRFVREHEREFLEMGFVDFVGNPIFQ